MLVSHLLIFLLTSSGTYTSQIEKEREERNERFRNPQTSPLATVAIRLLDKPVITFGSSPEADLVWKDPSIAPLHAKILRDPDSIRIEKLQGEVYSIPEREPLSREVWQVDQLMGVGDVMLVLQIHPVGPVVRLIDPAAEAFRSFETLDYFPVDPNFRLEGMIRPGKKREVTIVDTQGWTRKGWVYGRIEFEWQLLQQSLDLISFTENPSEDFMLIFQDRTSGRETYPACRYLYVPPILEGKAWIDFNRALNPSCAYGDGFACPLPLPGNRLDIAIRAGEKNFQRAH